MPRKRDPRRDQAFEMWKEHQGEITNREIAKWLDVPEKTISAWKNRDKWNAVLQKNERSTAKRKGTKQARAPSKKDIDEPIAESDELTEKQRLFCLYYVKYWNATKAYRKAYGCAYSTAMVEGSRHLRNPKISATIEQYKADLTAEKLLDAKVVLQKYIDIAFADITDYLTFGRKEIVVDHDKDGKPIKQEINYVDFKSSAEVDGTIVSEVKQGRDGVSIKLDDRIKALDKLEKYFDAIPDKAKDKSIALMQARIDGIKSEIKRKDTTPGKPDIKPYIEALRGKISEVWDDGDEE